MPLTSTSVSFEKKRIGNELGSYQRTIMTRHGTTITLCKVKPNKKADSLIEARARSRKRQQKSESTSREANKEDVAAVAAQAAQGQMVYYAEGRWNGQRWAYPWDRSEVCVLPDGKNGNDYMRMCSGSATADHQCQDGAS